MVSGSKTVIEASRKAQETKRQKKLYNQFLIDAVGKTHQKLGGLKNHYKSLGLDFSLFSGEIVVKSNGEIVVKSNKKGVKVNKLKTAENKLKNKKPTIRLNVEMFKNIYIHEINGKLVISSFENIHAKSKLKEVATVFVNKVHVVKNGTKQRYNAENNETVLNF
jgi:hypothetical protein